MAVYLSLTPSVHGVASSRPFGGGGGEILSEPVRCFNAKRAL